MAEGNLQDPVQSDEERRNVLAGATGGTGTATGQEKARLAAEDEGKAARPEGEDRGSKVPIAGGDEIVADASGNDVQKPIGAQAEPASFTSNGSLPLGNVATPGGLVPVSAVEASPEAATKRLEEAAATPQGKPRIAGEFDRVPRSVIENASAADLRAAASDRGWDLGSEAGARVTRARFLKMQNEKLGEEGAADTE